MARQQATMEILGMLAQATVGTAAERLVATGASAVLVLEPQGEDYGVRGLVTTSQLSRNARAHGEAVLEEVMIPWDRIVGHGDALSAVLLVVAAQDEIPVLGETGLFEGAATLDDVMAALWPEVAIPIHGAGAVRASGTVHLDSAGLRWAFPHAAGVPVRRARRIASAERSDPADQQSKIDELISAFDRYCDA